MAKPRPARCYRKPKKKAYTRTAKRVVRKAFIRGVPNIIITHFDIGNSGKDYKYQVNLITAEAVQIRHNALEAIRIVINKTVEAKISRENYHLQIRAYPHHVMRENAIISGAGADRLQTGMKHSFGKSKGKAARLKPGQTIVSVKVNTKKDIDVVRVGYKKVKAKLPCKTRVQIKELKK